MSTRRQRWMTVFVGFLSVSLMVALMLLWMRDSNNGVADSSAETREVETPRGLQAETTARSKPVPSKGPSERPSERAYSQEESVPSESAGKGSRPDIPPDRAASNETRAEEDDGERDLVDFSYGGSSFKVKPGTWYRIIPANVDLDVRSLTPEEQRLVAAVMGQVRSAGTPEERQRLIRPIEHILRETSKTISTATIYIAPNGTEPLGPPPPPPSDESAYEILVLP